MKKGLCVLGFLATVILLAVAAYAGVTTTGAINVTAEIQAGTPDMDVKIYKAPQGDWNLIDWDASVGSMAFDKFTVVQRMVGSSPVSQWTSVDQFVAFVYPNGWGKQYQIKSSGSGAFSDGLGHTLPLGSFACTPVYAPTDKWSDGTEQGAMPTGASLGSKGKAVPGPITVYTSENPGSPVILQVWYGFPPYTVTGSDPYTGGSYQPIPSNQANGLYTGVTATLDIVAPGP